MKNKTRTFYVSDSNICLLRDDYVMTHIALYTQPAHSSDGKITITFQDKPRTVTISEDDFDEIFYQGDYTPAFIKEKLFGASDESNN